MSEPTLFIYHSEGYSFRLLKELAAFDTEMPVVMADKLCDAYVRSDILVTPAVCKYIISRLEVIDTTKMLRRDANSIRKTLLFLYNIKQN